MPQREHAGVLVPQPLADRGGFAAPVDHALEGAPEMGMAELMVGLGQVLVGLPAIPVENAVIGQRDQFGELVLAAPRSEAEGHTGKGGGGPEPPAAQPVATVSGLIAVQHRARLHMGKDLLAGAFQRLTHPFQDRLQGSQAQAEAHRRQEVPQVPAADPQLSGGVGDEGLEVRANDAAGHARWQRSLRPDAAGWAAAGLHVVAGGLDLDGWNLEHRMHPAGFLPCLTGLQSSATPLAAGRIHPLDAIRRGRIGHSAGLSGVAGLAPGLAT
ncbi:MAG: hypothetical protein BWY56_02339 [Acidobacteria bacterium ADurb.Bin340]|nr:MAG: hypothetical protein BWY56_02339 [Acidobacteria bacterium ADurb.Bin340]